VFLVEQSIVRPRPGCGRSLPGFWSRQPRASASSVGDPRWHPAARHRACASECFVGRRSACAPRRDRATIPRAACSKTAALADHDQPPISGPAGGPIDQRPMPPAGARRSGWQPGTLSAGPRGSRPTGGAALTLRIVPISRRSRPRRGQTAPAPPFGPVGLPRSRAPARSDRLANDRERPANRQFNQTGALAGGSGHMIPRLSGGSSRFQTDDCFARGADHGIGTAARASLWS
jgi:hypothetical protein